MSGDGPVLGPGGIVLPDAGDVTGSASTVFGMPVVENPTLPAGVLELRDPSGRVLGWLRLDDEPEDDRP